MGQNYMLHHDYHHFRKAQLLMIKYPDIGSRTCCQGLVALGLLTINVSLLIIDLITSGIILFLAQSPPPITFPALPIPILI